MATAPTVGRKMYYRPNGFYHNYLTQLDLTQPFDATVLFVNTDGTVNLNVIDHIGNQEPRIDVKVVQADQDIPPEPYVEWMPYQVAQAKKDITV